MNNIINIYERENNNHRDFYIWLDLYDWCFIFGFQYGVSYIELYLLCLHVFYIWK